jgi:hypothetical protein
MLPVYWLMMIVTTGPATEGRNLALHVGNFSSLANCDVGGRESARIVAATPNAVTAVTFLCVRTNDERSSPPPEPK